MSSAQRSFIIGDSWLYFKIYAGKITCENILIGIIRPASELFLEKKIIDKWFFLRYADPKTHLRIRFHCNHPSDTMEIIHEFQPRLYELVNHDLIWRVQIDTYVRELERYGESTIELAEDIFFHDCRMILQFIDSIEGSEGGELRWLFGLKAIDRLLDNFKFEYQAKKELLEILKNAYGKEFGMSRALKMQLDEKFRLDRPKIEKFMRLEGENEYSPIMNMLDERSVRISGISEKILEHQKNGTLKVNLNSLLASFIHMTMNRLFIDKNRLHEMVCYDFLYRYYRSLLARAAGGDDRRLDVEEALKTN